MKKDLDSLRGHLDLPNTLEKLSDLNREIESSGFWDNPEKAAVVLKEKGALDNIVQLCDGIQKHLDDIEVMIALCREEEDLSMQDEIATGLQELRERLDKAGISALLSGEHDRTNAIVAIHPGAGGTESQDWASMLLRMYLRWAERDGYSAEVVDLLPGDEAGIKSATFIVNGEFAYGYLKCEMGVHRLVRISPYDAAKRRHTSFASVHVSPDIEEEIDIVIDEKDLKVDTYRASGAGGQHINKTESAIRITHIPSGNVVQCQSERSQHKNRASAMKLLKAKLYEQQVREQSDKIDKIAGEKKEIGFGSQIRSYVMQPYQMVKDQRTGLEMGNVEAVLDGDIDYFIEGYLSATAKK
ncbi:MAG: peptide chain release factor 2 [Nitrospirota bacterium]|nr:peptide chain release factor 2 [Nitrospirota bacterium]